MIENLFLISGVTFVFSLFSLALDTVENYGREQAVRTVRWLSASIVLALISTVFFIAGLFLLALPLLKGWVL